MYYLCDNCCKQFGITSNKMAVNEVGRKSCDECGNSSDWDLHIESETERESRRSSGSGSEKQSVANVVQAGATIIDMKG